VFNTGSFFQLITKSVVGVRISCVLYSFSWQIKTATELTKV